MQPTEVDAFEIAEAVLGEELGSVTRFPTGLQNYVYDVVLASGRRVVMRIALAENRPHLEGALHWDALLRPLGVPLPEVL